MIKKLISASVIVLFAGCAAVPATKISFDPKTGALKLQSPKNVAIDNVSVSKDTNGNFTLTVKGYSSTNDNSVVSAVAQANAASQKALADLGAQALTTAINAAK